jgi:hypothetical protein
MPLFTQSLHGSGDIVIQGKGGPHAAIISHRDA